MRMVVSENKVSTDSISRQKKAVKYAAYLTAFSAKSKRAKGLTKSALEASRLSRHCYGMWQECCSGKFLVFNYHNFQKTGLPARMMYFYKGSWVDFSNSLTDALKNLFRDRKSISEVSVGSTLYMFDFLRMIQINLETGAHRSIAWIDEVGNCFFPKFCVEESNTDGTELTEAIIEPAYIEDSINDNLIFKDGEEERKVRVIQQTDVASMERDSEKQELQNSRSGHMRISNKSMKSFKQSSECNNLVEDRKHQFKEELQVSAQVLRNHRNHVDSPLSSDGSGCRSDDSSVIDVDLGVYNCAAGSLICDINSEEHIFNRIKGRLTKLEPSDCEHATVKGKFLAGFVAAGKDAFIVNVYRCKQSLGNDYHKCFQNTAEITTKYRGNANMRFGWYGTSKEGVIGILSHGFGYSNVTNKNRPYGIGVYLAPENCSFVGAGYSDVDEKGEQYIILCRVILGNMEEIQPGSKQHCPSSENFDSGVDSIVNPLHYVVWGSHMNTHILPQYVVSFKVKSHVQEQRSRLEKDTSTNFFFKDDDNTAEDGNLSHCWKTNTGNSERFQRLLSSNKTSQMEIAVPVSSQDSRTASSEVDKKHIVEPSQVTARGPASSWIAFPKLFSVIENYLPKSSIDLLHYHYSNFKQRKLPREMLIKICRRIAGDTLLIAAIKSIKNQSHERTTSSMTLCHQNHSLASQGAEIDFHTTSVNKDQVFGCSTSIVNSRQLPCKKSSSQGNQEDSHAK
eukprot:TRINITY_DN2283_c0_g1_i4.p1 TRINITY_DN2283_c0_g1~~TRINITY_DN2283_c0_g1_i4.p1  ORF type:complete len:735 (-),score=124.86 TRINITY_DN2283_c0_g1_i4:366-2570(-)